MKFAQQNIGTVGLFGKEYWNVDMKDSPHYKFLRGEEKPYLDYLHASWSHLREKWYVDADRVKRAKRFKKMATFADVGPITVCKYRGETFVVDGNHRTAICMSRGVETPMIEIETSEYLKSLVMIPEHFYGSKNGGIPYQSVFSQGVKIIQGRRDGDTLERFGMIRREDIEGKTVVDIGCNIGANAILCAEAGAKVYGFDIVPEIVTAAIRINVILGLPCWYGVADFGQSQNVRGDVAMAFSVDQHIKNNAGLAHNLENYPIVYFETHQAAGIPKEILERFDAEMLGNLGKRKFYRLTRK